MSELSCFVMMPFDKGGDRILRLIREACTRVSDCQIAVHRADLGKPLDTERLERHIRRHIDRADFGIAEITDHNPNVMLEVGLTIAQDKPVILMVRRGCGAPVDLRGRLWFEYDPEEADALPKRLAEFISEAIGRVESRQLRSHYWASIYSNRAGAPYEDAIARASERVLINTTNLEWVVTSHVFDGILKRIGEVDKLQVRVLVLDPESHYAAERARELSYDVSRFREDLRRFLDYVVKALSPHGERCRIATYSAFPTQIVSIIDQVVFASTVSTTRRARENVVVELPVRHAGVKETFWDDFAHVWRDARLICGGELGLLP